MELSIKQRKALVEEWSKSPNGNNEIVEVCLNSLLKAERESFLIDRPKNKANGFRNIKSFGFGESINLKIPRDRFSEFKPVIQAIWQNQQAHLDDLIFEMYGAGLTTRELERIIKDVYGTQMSRSSISRITQSFYQEMKDFRERKLDSYYPIIYIDAHYLSVKRHTKGQVAKEAFNIILGVKEDTTREILGIYNNPTESASFWGDVFEDLKSRGIEKVNLIVADGLAGLENVTLQHFNEPILQKCVVHLMREVIKKVRTSDKKEIIKDLKLVFDMDNKNDTLDAAKSRLENFSNKWEKDYQHIKKISKKQDIEYYFSYLQFAPAIWRMPK